VGSGEGRDQSCARIRQFYHPLVGQGQTDTHRNSGRVKIRGTDRQAKKFEAIKGNQTNNAGKSDKLRFKMTNSDAKRQINIKTQISNFFVI
jgi:hypothetical protein